MGVFTHMGIDRPGSCWLRRHWSLFVALVILSLSKNADSRFAGCWFTSDEVRLLVNFVPRWIIIAIMLAMYTRLYLVLYRAHSPFASSHESTTEDLSRPSLTASAPNGRRIKKVGLSLNVSLQITFSQYALDGPPHAYVSCRVYFCLDTANSNPHLPSL